MKMKRCHRPEISKTGLNGKGKAQKPPTPDSNIHKSKERYPVEIQYSNQHLLKSSNAKRQENVSPDIAMLSATTRYARWNQSAATEAPVKTSGSPKQRSKSTVSDRQPWGQLLNKHTGLENDTVFCKFDPLRTLHFLARELQTHMQTRLPDETNLQEIIKGMHSALKRIPPEVASSVQLQQPSVECLSKGRTSNFSKESISLHCHNSQQSVPSNGKRNLVDFQKLIEGSTQKLEASCQHLENMCGQLKDEKLSLETLLQGEKAHSRMLQKRIDEMEESNRKLTVSLHKQDGEVEQLKGAVELLQVKLEEKNSAGPDVHQAMSDLKKSKLYLERENQKLEHQLRLREIEKEKYLAILAVRDRQINEIRNEMNQLQKSVNEQLVELHNYATSAIPHNITDQNGTSTVASIWAAEGFKTNPVNSPKHSDSEEDTLNKPTHGSTNAKPSS